MVRRYSWDAAQSERVPLDSQNHQYPPSSYRPPRQQQQQHHQPLQQSPSRQQSQPQYYEDYPAPYHDQAPTSPVRARNLPGGHPESDFARLRQERRQSRDYEASAAAVGSGYGAGYTAGDSPRGAPRPPPHRENTGRSNRGNGNGYGQSPHATITPGADNFGETAAGGLAGIATSVAERNPRQSGREAMRNGSSQYDQQQGMSQPQPQAQRAAPPMSSPYDQAHQHGYDRGYEQFGRDGPEPSPSRRADPYAAQNSPYQDASPNLAPLGAAALASGRQTPARSQHSYAASEQRSQYSHGSDPFEDTHAMYGPRLDPRMAQIDPREIMDDGDDGLDYRRSARTSMLSLGSDRGNRAAAAGAGVAAGAAAGGVVGGLLKKNRASYGPVNTGYQGAGASEYDLAGAGGSGGVKEQAGWRAKEDQSRNKRKWILWGIVIFLVLGGIAGGVAGGILSSRNKGGSSSGSTSGSNGGGGGGGISGEQDTKQNGDLNSDSAEIKQLMNNPNLHKVFPGVDYTPLNVQYPDCIHNPPSQNNVTRDVAVLSQLTNTIRLYGTDCNQTEMTIHALEQLKLVDSMKIWMGVWQDNNATTNARQLAQMWDILDKYGDKYFKGIIVANEVLFRKQLTITQLGTLLSDVRKNMTAKGFHQLPVATSDLGDLWEKSLADVSDYIMANIHPFFAGTPANISAGWTWDFWHNKAQSFFKADKSMNIISETGWPTGGGTKCPETWMTSCPGTGSTAGIDELNTFMADWVCQALNNGTNYFWFEMFDEPWKIAFNEKGKEWEDKWGLMDVNRNLKSGVKIPDCGGKTV